MRDLLGILGVASSMLCGCGSSGATPASPEPAGTVTSSGSGNLGGFATNAGTAVAGPRSCSADAPCTEPMTACMSRAADLMNCGPAMCREVALRCESDASCSPGQACLQNPGDPWKMCHAKSCKSVSDCGADANAACITGICTVKTCTKNAECEGYCLSGYCSHEPGICASTQPRP